MKDTKGTTPTGSQKAENKPFEIPNLFMDGLPGAGSKTILSARDSEQLPEGVVVKKKHKNDSSFGPWMSYCLALSSCSEISHLAEKENKEKSHLYSLVWVSRKVTLKKFFFKIWLHLCVD